MTKPKDKEIRKKIIYVALFCIVILTAFLGLYRINSESLWEDEINTLIKAQGGIWELLSGHLDVANPPVYDLFMHFWIRIFGISEVAMRLPSIIFGILSVLVIFYLGKELYNEETGLFSAFLLGISQFFISYMQEARSYSLLVLLSLLSCYLFIRFLKEKNNTVGLVYAVTIFIGLYVHYFMIFVIIVQNIFFVLSYKRFEPSIKKWFLIQTMVMILFSIWFLRIVLPNMVLENAPSIEWIQRPDIISVENLFNLFIGNIKISFIGIIFTMLVLFFFLYNLLDMKLKNFIFSEEELLLILYLFIPIILVFIISQFKPIWMPRYLIIVFPALILIIARTLLTFRLVPVQAGFLSILLIGNIFALHQMYMQPNKPDARSAATYIVQKYEKGDTIFCYQFQTLQILYYMDPVITKKVYYLKNVKAEGYPYDLNESISKLESFFIVYLNYKRVNNAYTNNLEPKIQQLNQSFVLIERMSFQGLRIEKYEKIYIPEKIENKLIQLPISVFEASKKENDTLDFTWTNASAAIKFRVPQNEYSLRFEILGTPPAPVTFYILLNGMYQQLSLNDTLGAWTTVTMDLGQISNETNNLQFIFQEDAYSAWNNGTTIYDRNGYIKNVSLIVKNAT